MTLLALALLLQDAPPSNPPIGIAATRAADVVPSGDGAEVFAEFVVAPPMEDLALVGARLEALDADGRVLAQRRSVDERGSHAILGSLVTYRAADGLPAGTGAAILRSHFGVYFVSEWRLPSGEGVARLRVLFTFRTQHGFLVSQSAETPASAATPAAMRCPVSGTWSALWGVSHEAPHRRAVVFTPRGAFVGPRYAYDLGRVDDGGRLARAAGGTLEEYYSWNEEVVAPADGRVVRVVDGLPDNPPGFVDARVPPGNHVILDHGNGVYSCLAHLKNGSVAVQEGDAVTAGQPVARVGNSGYSPYPHLHFQVMDAPSFYESQGRPVAFSNVTVQGQATAGLLRSGWIATTTEAAPPPAPAPAEPPPPEPTPGENP